MVTIWMIQRKRSVNNIKIMKIILDVKINVMNPNYTSQITINNVYTQYVMIIVF